MNNTNKGRVIGLRAVITSAGTAVGRSEHEGPLGQCFDLHDPEDRFGQSTWEKAESEMQRIAFSMALKKAKLKTCDIGALFAGDLLNQCVGSAYGLLDFGIPYYGLYGACSTMGESLSLAALMIDGGYASKCAAVTSSHFCTAERQYRMPVPYGSQRPPNAQWTATAAGCTILSTDAPGPYITHITCGQIVDKGITDANNMGAAMAPAAHEAISAYFKDTGTTPRDYDLILTGDLGKLGHAIMKELFARDGIDMGDTYQDCGLLLYDLQKQDMHAGASGCGCSASVLNGYLLTELRQKKWKRILFAPTGALLSPISSFQGESIPGICHVVCISTTKEG
jgi:stage V sporulation protein AD